MRKIWCIIGMLMLLGLTVTSAAEITITHLTYTHHGEKYHEYLISKAEEFNKLNPGMRVEVIIGLHDKFQTMLVGGVPPDVVDLPDFLHLGPAGQLVDIYPLLERDGLLRNYNPLVLQAMSSAAGAIYSMPFELSMFVTYFNRELFNLAGLVTPDHLGAEWTWDAVIQNSRKLTIDGNADGTPEIFGFDRATGAGWRNAVYQAGGKFYEFDDAMRPVKSLWNSAEVLAGISWNETFFRERITPTYSVPDPSVYYFWNGKTAIDVQDQLGIIGNQLKDAPIDWDIMLLPRGPAGPLTMGGGSGPHLLADGKNLEAAWAWVKFYAGTKENVERWMQLTGRMTCLLAAQPSYVNLLGIRDKNVGRIFEQSNYLAPIESAYPLPNELNPRRISLETIWRGTQPVSARLEEIHQQTTAFMRDHF
ncbi:MAG TPA: extracellular solute-binding protein [Firmicutes bacterium]|nr:extracellular solute-binding protein [Bacillota bacterium]